jgi:hypothetical protein
MVLLCSVSLQGQQQPPLQGPEDDGFDLLDAFLPSSDERDDDAKVLTMINCTSCHSPKETKDRISKRAGGDISFWTGLVWRMNTSWNARFAEEDITPIANYLAKHFGPSSKAASPGGAEEKR